MQIVKAIGIAILGWLVGYAAGFVAVVPLSLLINFFSHFKDSNWDQSAAWQDSKGFSFVALPLLSAIGSVIIYVWSEQEQASAKEHERQRREEAAHAAHLRELEELRGILDAAQLAAGSLPIALAAAEEALDLAEAELQAGLPSPFWEAMEQAVGELRGFHTAMDTVHQCRNRYVERAGRIEAALPFALGIAVLPDPSSTHTHMNRLYRRAQALDRFPIVYEQRRTTSAVTAGFRSLGQAIERLGDRISADLRQLAGAMDCQLGDLESSVLSLAEATRGHVATLNAELGRARNTNDALVGRLERSIAARTEQADVALRMLDNIQHHRRPGLFDRP